MPAIRDYSQAYHATTTYKHIEVPMPNYQTGDLLVALLSTDDSAAASMATTAGGMPVPYVFYNDDTGGTPSWTDYTVQANDSNAGDWFMTPTVPTVNDCIYFGSTEKFNRINVLNSVAGAATTNTVWALEYYDSGTGWTTLTTLTNTFGANMEFVNTVHAEATWNLPANWATTTPAGSTGGFSQTAYWVRWRCTTSNTFQTRPVSTQAWIFPILNGNNGWRLLYSNFTGTTPAPICAMWKIAGVNEDDTTFFYLNAETPGAELISIRDVEPSVDTGVAALTINVTAATRKFVRTTGNFVTDGFLVGQTIQTSGFTNGGNNTSKIIESISTTTITNDTITVTSGTGLVDESGNNDERVICFPFNGLGFATSNAASATGRNALPTMTTDKDNCLLIWQAAPDAISVPCIIEGACQLIAGKDNTGFSDSCAWGFQAKAGTTPTVYESSMNTSGIVTEMAVLAVNSPSTGATVIPGYTASDSSTYVTPLTGAAFSGFGTDSATTNTITTTFTGTINGKPLVVGATTVTQADTGINSYHAMSECAGVVTAKTWAGVRTVIASRNLASHNILFHIQPMLPVDIQTTDSVSLNGVMGVAIGLASTTSRFKVWHVGGTFTSWGTQRHSPVVINTDASDGIIQTTESGGSFDPTGVTVIGVMVSGKIVLPRWLVGSVWALDTCVVAGGISTEPLDLPQIIRAYADGHERRSGILEGTGQALILGPLQLGDGGTNPIYLGLDSTAIEFPRQYDKSRREVYYNSVDNYAGLIYYAGPGDTILHQNSVVSSPSRYKWGLHSSSFANFATSTRARSSNVATIVTSSAHGLSTGNTVAVRNLADTTYNGTWTVASTPTGSSFTYNNTGGDEGEIADTNGTVGPYYNFSGLSVIGAGTITLGKTFHITGLTINNYSTLDMTGLNFDVGKILNVPAGNDTLTTSAATFIENSEIDVTGVTAGNRWCSVASPVIFENNTFTGSASAGHAIRITSAGTYTFVGNIFNSFGPAKRSFNTGTGVNSGTEVITLDDAHGYSSGDPAYYQKQGGTQAIGLTDGNLYYVRNESSTTITLYDTAAHAIAGGATGRADLTSGGSETHYIYSAGAAIYNNSGGAVTLNISAGGTTPSIRESNGSSTTINNSVTLEVNGVKTGSEPTNYVRCRIEARLGGSLPAGTQIMNTEAQTSYGSEGYYKATQSVNYTGDQPVTIRARYKGYIPFETTGTITSNGLAVTAVWITDSNFTP